MNVAGIRAFGLAQRVVVLAVQANNAVRDAFILEPVKDAVHRDAIGAFSQPFEHFIC